MKKPVKPSMCWDVQNYFYIYRKLKNDNNCYVQNNLQVRIMLLLCRAQFICLFVLTCYFFAIPAEVAAGSFNCAMTLDKTERMICNDAELSNLDEELVISYKQVLEKVKNKQTLIILQQRWFEDLKQRGMICKGYGEEGCLKNSYRNRIKWLSAYSDANSFTIPSRIPGVYRDFDNRIDIKLLTPILTIVKIYIVDREWLCDFEGYGTWNGSRLVVRDDAGSKYGNNCIINLTFKSGRVATKAEPFEDCKYYCGLNASLDGIILKRSRK
jgi:uncharacterized protein